MEPISVWEATANERPERPSLKDEQHCDVAIIGGGFTGLSTAYHLQEKQCKTIILEKGRVGSGASGRNGGEVLTGYVGTMESIVKKKGIKAARQMWQLSLDSIDLVETIIEKEHISCAFKRNGDIRPAYKLSHMDSLKREQEFMAEKFNFHEIKIIEKADLHTELNTSFYHGGRVNEKSAHFHPLNYTLGLAEAVEKMKGRIYEHSEVTGIQRDAKNKVILNTNGGRVIADQIVIATNAYSGDLNQLIKKSIVPVESIMIATETLPQTLMEDLIKKDRAASDSKHLLYYFRRTADNRLAFGGSGRASSKRDQRHLFDRLHEGMIEVFPQLKNAQIEYRWGGKVGFTKEMVPYMGQLEDGTHFAFGYAGHGAAMSSLLGKCLADNILNGEDINNPLRKEKLRPIPFHSQHAKAVGILKYYKKFQDRFF